MRCRFPLSFSFNSLLSLPLLSCCSLLPLPREQSRVKKFSILSQVESCGTTITTGFSGSRTSCATMKFKTTKLLVNDRFLRGSSHWWSRWDHACSWIAIRIDNGDVGDCWGEEKA